MKVTVDKNIKLELLVCKMVVKEMLVNTPKPNMDLLLLKVIIVEKKDLIQEIEKIQEPLVMTIGTRLMKVVLVKYILKTLITKD